MKRNLLRLGLLSLLLVFAFIAKAQNVTAVWDFQKNLPEGINTAANFQGNEGDLASTVEGITMHVNATQGKLKGRTSDAQYNVGTILQIPVKSAKDVVSAYGKVVVVCQRCSYRNNLSKLPQPYRRRKSSYCRRNRIQRNICRSG